MEFRWLNSEEQRTRAVESASLAEVLALAQQLQAEGEARVSDEQVVEMGRELGIRPEYVREAMQLRRGTASPTPVRPEALLQNAAPPSRPVGGSLMSALCTGIGLGTLPMALIALAESHAQPISLFVLFATLAAGWSARHPRLAGAAGAVTAPLIVLASLIFLESSHYTGMRPEAFLFSLLSFTPLGSVAGRLGAALHRRLERVAEERPPLPLSGR
jgi:hypothetical protein